MDWSAPDPDGIRTCRLDDPLRASLKGQRRLRRGNPRPLDLDTWPAEDRKLLADWVRRASDKAIRHETLLRAAGPQRAMTADRLLQTLLRAGSVEIEESSWGSAVFRMRTVKPGQAGYPTGYLHFLPGS